MIWTVGWMPTSSDRIGHQQIKVRRSLADRCAFDQKVDRCRDVMRVDRREEKRMSWSKGKWATAMHACVPGVRQTRFGSSSECMYPLALLARPLSADRSEKPAWAVCGSGVKDERRNEWIIRSDDEGACLGRWCWWLPRPRPTHWWSSSDGTTNDDVPGGESSSVGRGGMETGLRENTNVNSTGCSVGRWWSFSLMRWW